ncbi:MAG: DNA polymerase III subunit alpha [Candidatus Humimicrobiaceae bacterium]
MFCHLHVHSEYSLLASSVKIKNLISTAKTFGMKSLALTDTVSMHGAIEFYREAKENNIKPLLGAEVMVTKNKIPSSIILIAKDINGYKNLCRIISNANLQRRNCASPVDFGLIKDLSIGIIAISEFESSEFFCFLQKNNTEEADLRLKEWVDVFGDDFYIEIQRTPLKNSRTNDISSIEKRFKEKIIVEFAAANNVKITAGNDVHYLLKQDYCIYEQIAKLKLMSSKENILFFNIIGSNENYFKSLEEMQELFCDLNDALKNTEEISDKCSLVLELYKNRLPYFEIPEGETQESHLRKLCYEKIPFRYGEKADSSVYQRLEYELSVIEKTGFCGYFLIVADIARFAFINKIPTCGKGSSAGSMVAYLLGISNVDPVKQNLCFERFLNGERKDLPDIDIDMSSKGRCRAAEYLSHTYGKYNVLRVPVFTTFKSRASVREAGRILSLGKEEMDDIIRLVPSRSVKPYEDKKEIIGNNSIVMNISDNLKGYIRHIAMHPCAFIVLGKNMSENIPLMSSETGETMSQYSIKDIEAMGFLKIDLINSLTLDHIDEVMEILKKTRDVELDFTNIAYDDKAVYEILSRGDTIGTFQLESMGIRSLMKKLKPGRLEDITLLISLYRPGPQQSGMVDIFIERKFKRCKVDFLHEDLREILEETCGVMLYQEQVMKAAVKIAGYSFGEADKLRKTSFDAAGLNMEQEKCRFVKGAEDKGYEKDFAEKLFGLISKFASYGFVKAHAAAYAEIGYKTCYLKVHYPAELLSVILTKNSGYYSRNSYIEEARRLGINIRLPDINLSDTDFLTENLGRSIRVSLISIRDLGTEGTENITKERLKNGLFKNFSDFHERIIRPKKITVKAAENLIKVGAFDFTGLKRKYLLLVLEYLLKVRQKKQLQISGRVRIKKSKEDIAAQKDVLSFGDLRSENGFGSPHIINEDFYYLDDFFPETSDFIQDYSLEEKLELENGILGFCVSANSLKYFENDLAGLNIIKSSDFNFEVNAKIPYKKNILTSGIVLIRRKEKTKTGKEIIFLTLEDTGGMYETVLFADQCLKNAGSILPGTPVLINGNISYKSGDISIVADKIINLAALKKLESKKSKEDAKSGLLAEAGLLWKV